MNVKWSVQPLLLSCFPLTWTLYHSWLWWGMFRCYLRGMWCSERKRSETNWQREEGPIESEHDWTHTQRLIHMCAHIPDYKHAAATGRSLMSVRNCGLYIYIYISALLRASWLVSWPVLTERIVLHLYVNLTLCSSTFLSSLFDHYISKCLRNFCCTCFTVNSQTFDGLNTVVNVKRLCFVHHRVDLPYQRVRGTFIL